MRNHGSSSHHESMTYVDMADDVMGFLADQVGVFSCLLRGTGKRNSGIPFKKWTPDLKPST